MIVFVWARRVPMGPAEAGMGAPVGQAVASSKVMDGERWAGGDVEVWKLPQVVVVLWRRIREVLLLLPHALIHLSGKSWKMNSLTNIWKCYTNWSMNNPWLEVKNIVEGSEKHPQSSKHCERCKPPTILDFPPTLSTLRDERKTTFDELFTPVRLMEVLLGHKTDWKIRVQNAEGQTFKSKTTLSIKLKKSWFTGPKRVFISVSHC